MNIRPATQVLFALSVTAAAGCSSASEEDVAATPAPAIEAETDTAAAARDTVAYEARRDTAAPPIQARVETDPEVTSETDARVQADVSADADAAVTSHTFDLTSLNNSTAAGQVTVRQVGEQEVEVAISLSGVEANAQRTAAVYRGTCDNPGSTVEALQDVGAGAGAQSTTTLQLPLTQLLAGDHVVIVREDAMGQSNAIACAELMQQQ